MEKNTEEQRSSLQLKSETKFSSLKQYKQSFVSLKYINIKHNIQSLNVLRMLLLCNTSLYSQALNAKRHIAICQTIIKEFLNTPPLLKKQYLRSVIIFNN